MNKIFIQIAAYRDPQLLLTIKDCITNARQPHNLVFCIAWQHCDEDIWDTLNEYKSDSRFIILDLDYKISKGVCWARNLIQQQYNQEEYTLQLDSHHRFVSNWDSELINMYQNLKKAGYSKPLITSYLPAFNPENDPKDRYNKPYQLTFDRFTPEGVIFFLPVSIDIEHNEPLRCSFYSGHFCFTSGSFCKEVQHDPNLYFHGEEISIAVRAFTWGYDLFNPNKIIGWHEYTRKNRQKHWDDHKDWININKQAFIRLRTLLNIDTDIKPDIDFGIYGLGSVRSLEDYEKFSGIKFKDRSVQSHTLNNKLPPNPNEEYICRFKHCLNVHESMLKSDNYKFIAIIFEDDKGKSYYRRDISHSELLNCRENNDPWYNIWESFIYEGTKPYKYIIWPYSEKDGWCDKIEEIIQK